MCVCFFDLGEVGHLMYPQSSMSVCEFCASAQREQGVAQHLSPGLYDESQNGTRAQMGIINSSLWEVGKSD